MSINLTRANFVEPYGMTVFLDDLDNKFKAKNGLTSAIPYSGTDASTVINSALAVSKIVMLKNANYRLYSSLVCGLASQRLVAESRDVILEGNSDIDFITASGNDVSLENMTLDGWGSNVTRGVNMTGADVKLVNVLFQQFGGAYAVRSAKWRNKLMMCRFLNNKLGLLLDSIDANENLVLGTDFYTGIANATHIDLQSGDTLVMVGSGLEGLQASTTGIHVNYTASLMAHLRTRFESLLNGVAYESGKGSYDVFVNPTFATVTNPFVNKPATTRIVHSLYGYVTENIGSIAYDGNGSTKDFPIGAHGLSVTDASKITVVVVPTTADAITGSPCIGYVDPSDTTKIRCLFTSAPPSGTGNVGITWKAVVE